MMKKREDGVCEYWEWRIRFSTGEYYRGLQCAYENKATAQLVRKGLLEEGVLSRSSTVVKVRLVEVKP